MQSRSLRPQRGRATVRRSALRFLLILSVAVTATVHAAATPADVAALEAFVDGVIAEQFDTYDLVGVVVSVVRDGEPLFAKGYGYADLESLTPVDPDRTLFRIGSITKLFTWTAVMQLVEQGALDLDADVNDYLRSVRVPATYPEPVTMAHLMAHTAGFEDRSVGLFARTADSVRPLSELLGAGLPARVRPVGQAAAYSNHGVALAGLVVEELSGLAWNDYLEARILTPLGMTRTTGVQPVPDPLARDLAIGYDVIAGSFVPRSFDYSPLAPAGSMSTTASDMTRFMLAHLGGGSHGGAAILRDVTVQQMHRTHSTFDPRLSGMAHGFVEQQVRGRRTIGHGGGIVAFNSLMLLVPDESLGLFISYSTLAGAPATVDFVAAFFEHLAAGDLGHAPMPTNLGTHTPNVTGSYRPSRVAHTTLDKLAGLLQEARIAPGGDGGLLAHDLGMPGTTRWVPIEPAVYREVDSGDLLVFQTNDRGDVVRGLVGSLPHLAYERIAWHQRAAFHLGLVSVILLVMLSALIGWPLSRRRGRGDSPASRLARLCAWATSALFVVFLASLLVVLRDPMEIAFGVPPPLRAVLVLGLAGTALTPVCLLLAARSWLHGDWNALGRVHYSVVAAAAAVFVWFLHHWNLLGFRY